MRFREEDGGTDGAAAVAGTAISRATIRAMSWADGRTFPGCRCAVMNDSRS
ncbi:hypothetical protein KIPE111705_45235 [Kibdelosporangium persicum]|uniref:hypothetical protein n=1 Tax=Kibdelosporangium persicum TaxID=2698649 RepID=UPI001FECC121|nr:hypothetical protein [Kibdelosporangium persicum]